MSAAARAERERTERLAAAMEARGLGAAELACVLGSGLGAVAERLEDAAVVPFAELEGMPRSAVPGHAGRFVLGRLAGVRVVVQSGRAHLYEGRSAPEVTRAARALAAAGVRGLVLTNAAGGLARGWPPGTLMRLVDHLCLQGAPSIVEGGPARGTVYDSALGAALDGAAAAADVRLERGVYAAVLGPSYETPAEIRMLRWMGADAVGMSTALEASAAAAAGMRVAAVSCVTNPAAGIATEPLSHAEVVRAGAAAAGRLARLLESALPPMARVAASGSREPRARGAQ